MSDAQTLQLIAACSSLVSIIAIGGKLIRSSARVEMRVNMIWKWYKQTHGIDGDE